MSAIRLFDHLMENEYFYHTFKSIYAATLYIVEFVSSAWDRTSLVKMSQCRINDQHMSWHFMATLPWQFNEYSKRIIEL